MINRLFTLLGIFLMSALTTYGQWALTNTSKLEEMAARFREQQRTNLEQAIQKAREQNRPFKMEGENGEIAEIQGITENGELIYYITDNLDAAKTVSTNKVWPGGGLGYNLTGSMVKIGEWDGGAVRLTHVELTGRVTQVDGASSQSDHATHVAGTMVASGVDSDAKGMAYAGSLDAYDWNFDNSEMATAAGNGMLISNHSYGTITGWRYNTTTMEDEWWGDTTISATEDYKFGFYNSTAQAWDQIAKTAPYYLIVKSAGNDRGDNGTVPYYMPIHNTYSSASRPVDGGASGYDCISTSGNAKNILTIGAVNAIPGGYSSPASVVMSSFSGWGPTDDGRIKPDIVANGVGVYSSLATNNTAYASYNGTSMSSPNTSGSLALIQEHYNNEHSSYMLSATLKALVIHTADEAGSATGPDYQFGWGLLNTASAVQHISNVSGRDAISENTLNNGQTYDLVVTSDGTTPLRATICWTDDAGTPPSVSIDPTNKMLVNDLDLRIIQNSTLGTTMPYVLNPSVPTAAATQADNDLDNVEQVYISSPASGTYTIRVTHKGTLASGQDFSLIVSGGILAPDTINCMQTIGVYPYSEDFEAFSMCSSTPGVTCNLLPASGWTNASTDSIDWTTFSGSTPTASTGPDMDQNPGTITGKYLYLESSGAGAPSMQAILLSPCFDLLITDPQLSFAYHMSGSNMGNLSVDVNSGISWTNVWFRNGDQGSGWQSATIDLSAYEGDTIQIRFRGITGSGGLSDMAIDDIKLQSNPLECTKVIGSFPYTEDFESFSTCSTTPGAACVLPSASGWYNGTTDDIDWTTDDGGTTSSGTGPSTDYNPGTLSGNYLYTEASTNGAGFPNMEAILYGPCFDLTNASGMELSFAYHMFGGDMGTLYLEVDTGNGWNTWGFANGDQGDQWNIAYIDLTDFEGMIVQFRFRGVTGNGFESDIAIDDIRVGDPLPRVYCTSGATNTIDSHVSNVTLESINNTTSNCTGYSDFTNILANLKVDSTYSLSVTTGDCDGGNVYSHAAKVYIDWNHDGQFSAGEEVLDKPYGAASTTVASVTVPSNAAVDSVRMRVICNESPPIDPCGTYAYGETEDYTIVIISGPLNDDCDEAIQLECGVLLQGTTFESKPETGVSTCGTSITAPGVWYKATGNGQPMTVSLCNGVSNYDTKLNVFSGSCGSFVCVGGNDNFCSTSSEVTWSSTNGVTYYILVQGANGETGDFEILLNTTPSSAIAAGGATTFCIGGSVTLTADPSSQYQWFRNSSPLGGAISQNYSATTSGNYTVQVTDQNNCSATTAVPMTVTVNSLPVVTVTPGGSTTFCLGGSVILSSTSGNGYQWYQNGTAISGATALQYTASTPGSYNVIMTDANNCSDSAATAVSVTVNPLPVVTLNATGSTTFCNGDSVGLNSSAGSGYQWYRNGTSMAGASSQLIYAKTSGSYNVIVTDGNNCSDSAATAIGVTVNPLPVVNITSGGSTTFCEDDSVSLSVSPVGNYQWFMDGTALTGATQSSYTTHVAGIFNVIVTDGNNCSDSAANGMPTIVNTLPLVALSFTGDTSICENDSLLVTAGPGPGYQWLKEGLPAGGATGQQYALKSTGKYNVRVTDGNGCKDTAVAGIDLTVDPLPLVQFTAVPDLCNTIGSYVLTQGTPLGGAYSGTAVTGDSLFDPSTAGVGNHDITYFYTDPLTGCSNSSIRTVTVVNCVGIDETLTPSDVAIYPNPSDGRIRIEIQRAYTEARLIIWDMNGKEVAKRNYMEAQNGPAMQLDLSHLEAGVYMMRLAVDEKITTKKLVIK